METVEVTAAYNKTPNPTLNIPRFYGHPHQTKDEVSGGEINNPRKTWRYTNEFKAKAVQLSLLEGVQVQDVAKTLDIHPFMLSRWRKEYREGKIVADKRK